MATLKEVARKAGVSVATVSYVINDIRKVSPQTEERVRRAARELGYSRAMGRASFRPLTGLVVPDVGNPFFLEIMKSFQDAANLADMEVIVMNTNSDLQRTHKSIERLGSLHVAGAAFFTTQVDAPSKQALAARHIPSVYLDYGSPAKAIGTLAVDYRHGMIEAVDHLRQLGHSRIGLIGGPEGGVAAQKRKLAFLEHTAAAAIEARVIDSDFSVQGGYFSCSKLLSTYSPSAVIAANDLMAIGAMHCAFDRQVRIPEELSIIGFDDITFAQFTQPALTTVAVPRAEIGKAAFDSIFSMIGHPEVEGTTYEVATTLVRRQSTAPPKGS